MDEQSRIDEATRFFDLLYEPVKKCKYSYLWLKQGKTKKTIPFDVSKSENREEMARQAIKHNDEGYDVFFGVCLTDTPPISPNRAKAKDITLQVAVWTDVDTEGGTHINDKEKGKIYPPDFDTAKSFLPAEASILINSSYGLHEYKIYTVPLVINDDNRESARKRNKNYIDIIKRNADKFEGVDGVQDLARVLRVPGTYNFKLGRENAPLCHIVEVNDITYSTDEIDRLIDNNRVDEQSLTKSNIENINNSYDYEYEKARAIKMLEFINVSTLSYDEWRQVGCDLKDIGCSAHDWDTWSRPDRRYKDGECFKKWDTFTGGGDSAAAIGNLCNMAKVGGYDDKTFYYEWHNTHKTVKSKSKSIADDKENQVEEAIEILNSITNYTPADVLQDKVFKAAALCKLKAPVYFDSFKKVCKLNKIDMSTFNSNVDNYYKELRRAKLKVISNPQFTLRENKDKTQYLPPLPDNINFDFKPPTGYVMNVTGIYQNTKDGLKRISRSAIIVSKLIRNIDEGICKTQLACCKYGKQWITAPAVDNNIIASKQKIVSMSDHEIDINSNNASAIIEFIAEFTAFNIDTIPKASSVNQTGWRKNGEFVYPNTDSDYVLDDSIKSQLDKIFAVEGKKENVTPLIHKIKKVDVSNINLGATLAAPLVHILKIDNIVMHTYGLAGSGKTIQNTFLFSLFGNPKANLAMPGADATRVGLENLFAGRHDLPAFIEDLNSVKGDKKFQSIVQQLPYQFGNGTGRLRGKPKGGNQNLINIRGTLLTTDEKPLTTDTSAGGGKRRVIELKTPNEMFDTETAAEIDDIIRENYGLFGREWIELIKENRAGMKDMYDEIRKGTKDSPGLQQEFINKVPRHIQSIAAITTANIFFDVHFLNIKFEIAYKQEISCARRILQTLPDKKEMADFERAKPIIINWFLQHRKKFVDDSAYEENTPQYNETKSYEEYGILKKDFIAVNTTVFRKMLNDNDFSPDIVIRQLIDDGFLIRDGKNLEKRIRVKGLDKLIRMTCIDKSKIEEMPSE